MQAFNIWGTTGDESLQGKVLLDFVQQNPDAKDGKRGKSRGPIELTTYVNTQCSRLMPTCETITLAGLGDLPEKDVVQEGLVCCEAHLDLDLS